MTINYHPDSSTRALGIVLTLLILVMPVSLLGAEPVVLEWEDLVPATGKGIPMSVPSDAKTIGAPLREDFDGDDEEYNALIEIIEIQRYNQPQGSFIRPDLDGKTVRIPGYITPIDFDATDVKEFLLVPYLGACIHVPAPPGNQIVYVTDATGLDIEQIYEPVWITGKLRTQPLSTIFADVGYRIDGAKIELYDQ